MGTEIYDNNDNINYTGGGPNPSVNPPQKNKSSTVNSPQSGELDKKLDRIGSKNLDNQPVPGDKKLSEHQKQVLSKHPDSDSDLSALIDEIFPATKRPDKKDVTDSDLKAAINNAKNGFNSLVTLRDTRNALLAIKNERKIESHAKMDIDTRLVDLKTAIIELENLELGAKAAAPDAQKSISDLKETIQKTLISLKNQIDSSKTEEMSHEEAIDYLLENTAKTRDDIKVDSQRLDKMYDAAEAAFHEATHSDPHEKRDMKTLEKITRSLAGKNMQEYADSLEGKGEKISRRVCTDLTRSYFITSEGQYVGQLHKTASHLAHHVVDSKVFIGQGGNKIVYKMENDLVRQVAMRGDQDLTSAIEATKVEAFKNDENLMVGHYMTYTSEKTGETKQVFFAPLMTGDMENKTFSVKEVLSTSLQAAKGLQTMHMNGWAHFDIKPANIIMREVNGEKDVKLMDFDFAKDLTGVSNRKNFRMCGTIGYISPELMQGNCKGMQGAQENDIFSLGVTLLENAGFNLWEDFTARPDMKAYRKRHGDQAVHFAFQSYMQSFDVNNYIDKLNQFNKKNPELTGLVGIAYSMMGPDDERPEITEVVAWLEELNAKVNQ